MSRYSKDVERLIDLSRSIASMQAEFMAIKNRMKIHGQPQDGIVLYEVKKTVVASHTRRAYKAVRLSGKAKK